ncbi:unnamed protein product [Linum trigynum]|uniref:Uncharacterized protein n=1 Tax=Linum trigynum TaxID=586398 RepID=A0AAV2EY02_9ROSI
MRELSEQMARTVVSQLEKLTLQRDGKEVVSTNCRRREFCREAHRGAQHDRSKWGPGRTVNALDEETSKVCGNGDGGPKDDNGDFPC